MKRFLSIALTLCIATAVGLAGLIPAAAAPAEVYTATLAVIEAYNETHGGIGELAAAESGNEIIVTGEVMGATKGIVLPHRVIWKAKLSGDIAGEALIKGSVKVIYGAEVFTDGRAIEGQEILVDGGVVFGAEAIYAPGGIVRITGGIVEGNIYASQLSIENARVDIDDGAGLENSIVYVAPTATANLEDKLTNYIEDNGQGLLTVVGNVTLTSAIDFEILYIPEDAELTVTNAAFALAEDALLIVDGKLELPADHDYSGWEGTVTGQNADNLKGYWSKDKLPGEEYWSGNDDLSEDEPSLKWWQKAPSWAQWVLRYVCFGWSWMKD